MPFLWRRFLNEQPGRDSFLCTLEYLLSTDYMKKYWIVPGRLSKPSKDWSMIEEVSISLHKRSTNFIDLKDEFAIVQV